MAKIDFKKQLAYLYQPSASEPVIVDVPPMQFVMIDGAIEAGQSPGTSPAFQSATQALYGISYTLKFFAKQMRENPLEYSVSALEALWWIESGVFDIRKPDNWHWTAMIMQPPVITESIFQECLVQLRKKKPEIQQDGLRFGTFHEGLSVQIMHIGPYAAEPATVERMESFAQAGGYRMRGRHHEIYLSDPRRAEPDKMKTVLRHPVEPVVPAG